MTKHDEIIGKKFYSRIEFSPDPEGENKKFDLVFSNQSSIIRRTPFYSFIMGHEPHEVDLGWLNTGRAPLLLDHNPSGQIGVIESAEIRDLKGYAVARLSDSSEALKVLSDIRNEIRTSVSMGYIVDNLEVVEENAEGPDILRITSWSPLEISLVSIPADQAARVLKHEHAPVLQRHKRRKNMSDTLPGSAPISSEKKPALQENHEAQLQGVRKKELERIQGIHEVSELYSHFSPQIEVNKNEFIKSGKSADDFRGFILEEILRLDDQKDFNSVEKGKTVGLSEKEIETFSFMKFFKSLAYNDQSLAPFEHEVIKASRDRFLDSKAEFVIPMDVLVARGFQRHELTTTGDGTGQQFVGTFHDAANFIDLLRERLICAQAGARFMTGLVQNLSIPKQTSGATSYWVDEGADVTLSDLGTGAVVLSPKTTGAASDITRQMLLQSSPDVESLVREDLVRTVATAIDKAAFQGTNANGQPKGVLNHAIGAIDYADDPVDWADLVGLEGELDVDNALMGSLSYFVHPKMVTKLKTTLKAAGVPGYLWESSVGGNLTSGLGVVNGYRAFSTGQIPEKDILFGNMSDLMIGQWGGMGINIDPYTKSLSGGLRIVVLQSIDIGVRHEESFAKATT